MATVGGTGLGTIDVATIVGQLMTVERRPLTKLAQREAGIQARITAYGSLKGALSTFQGALSSLNSVGTFQGVKASSSDEAQVKVSASNASSRGAHSVRVTALASAHAVASANFTNRDAVIGTGTLVFEKGTFAAGNFTANTSTTSQTVTIAANQSSMAGIRDAVNAAKIGVTASIVNDGAGERLVFASTDGAANSLRISVGDADGSDLDASGLSALAYNPAAAMGAGKNLSEMRVAQDATAIIDGITVTSATNTFASALDGVTLTALATGTTAAAVKVEPDTAPIKSGIEGLVKAYNDLRQQLKSASGYNADTKQAGPLNGDSTVRSIESDLRRMLAAQVGGAGALRTLADIGLSLDREGVLKLDSTKLQKQLDTDPASLVRLFAKGGITTDSRVSYAKATGDTAFGTYEVSITQVATRGQLGGQAAAGLTITSGVNDALSLTVDGIQANLTLTAKTYANTDELLAELRTRIASSAALTEAKVGVTLAQTGGVITATSNRHGSASTVTASGNAAAGLFGASPVTSAGVDVAGTIGTVAATGNGQELTGTGAAKGLALKITSSTTGALGTVDYFEGIAARLDKRITNLLGTQGSIKARTDGLEASVKDIRKATETFGDRLTAIEQRYRRQFSALDASLGSMASTSTYLQQQLTAIASNTASR